MDRVARRGPLAWAPGALTSHNAEKLKGGTLWGFSTSILSQNMKKLKKKIFFIFGRKSHNAEKNWKEEPFGIFQHPFCRKTSKKCRGDPLRKKISKKKSEKKCLAVPKKIERGDSLVSPGMICYAEKQVKPFWFSSLGQMVLFDTIIFCRTFKNYFGQFVWIEKKSHYNSRVSLHEAPTKKVTSIVSLHFTKRRLKASENLTICPLAIQRATNHDTSLHRFWFFLDDKLCYLNKKTQLPSVYDVSHSHFYCTRSSRYTNN